MKQFFVVAACSFFLLTGCLQAVTHFDPKKDLADIKPSSAGPQTQELRPPSVVYSLKPLKINIDDKLLNLLETYESNEYPLVFPTGVLISRIFEKDTGSELSLKLIKTNMLFGTNEHQMGCTHTADYEMMVAFEKNGLEDYIPIRVKGCGSRGWPWAGRAAIEEAALTLYQIAEEKLK